MFLCITWAWSVTPYKLTALSFHDQNILASQLCSPQSNSTCLKNISHGVLLLYSSNWNSELVVTWRHLHHIGCTRINVIAMTYNCETIFVSFWQMSESHPSSSLSFPPSFWVSSLKIKTFELFFLPWSRVSSFKESSHPIDAARSHLPKEKEMWQALFQQHWHQAKNNMSIVPSGLSVSSKLRWFYIIPLSMSPW